MNNLISQENVYLNKLKLHHCDKMPLHAEDQCSKCNDYNIDILLDKQGASKRVIVYFCKSCEHIEVEFMNDDGVSCICE